jgi:hypothetical protein
LCRIDTLSVGSGAQLVSVKSSLAEPFSKHRELLLRESACPGTIGPLDDHAGKFSLQRCPGPALPIVVRGRLLQRHLDLLRQFSATPTFRLQLVLETAQLLCPGAVGQPRL